MSTIHQIGAGVSRLGVAEPAAAGLRSKNEREAIPLEQREEVEPTTRAERVEPTRAALEKMTDEMNHTLSSVTSLKFSVDDESRRLVVRVVDRNSDEVIRQIPNEEMIQLAKKMKDLQGVLLNATV